MCAEKGAAERAKALERAMDRVLRSLEEQGYVYGEALVDREGHPRSDIDVYTVSKALSEYRRLRAEWRPLRDALEARVLGRGPQGA